MQRDVNSDSSTGVVPTPGLAVVKAARKDKLSLLGFGGLVCSGRRSFRNEFIVFLVVVERISLPPDEHVSTVLQRIVYRVLHEELTWLWVWVWL